MPFRVKWSDSAVYDFHLLRGQGRDMSLARQVVGSRPHDFWLQGEPYPLEGFPDADIRILVNEGLGVVFTISVEEEMVEIILIRRID